VVTGQVEELGRMGPSPLKAQLSRQAAGKLTVVPAFDQMQYLGHAYFGSVASSGTSGSGQFNWLYTAPTTATETPIVFTVEFGMLNATKRLKGAVGKSFKWSMEAGDFHNIEMDFIGKDISSTGALTALTDVVVNDKILKASDTSLWIDGATGTIGSTLFSGVLISAELNVDTMRHLKPFVGTTTPANYGTDKWVTSLKLVLEATTAVQDIIDVLSTTGAVDRQIQLTCTYSTNYAAGIKFAGHLSGDIKYWDDRDGNAIVETNWVGNHSTALGSHLILSLINATSILT